MSSDQEASGSSSAQSPHDSPYSSPSQQIPQLTNFLTKLKCADNVSTTQLEGNTPYLRITEQPQDHFRFRYRSEMLGTHGCIFGRSHITNKTKSHPTVELVNYTGTAIITCCLAQHNNLEDHPHQLFEDYRVKDSEELPVKGRYKIAFPDMGVIHNSKNEVKGWLFKKYVDEYKKKGTSYNANQLRAHCDNCVKEIEMNIVRLKFSARDARTGRQICDPVFSDPIHNMKSAATNDLKICRLSRISGSVNGGDDVIMLCEKVNKKNIKIRFFEMKNGVRTWTEMGAFMPPDVHHQYAITFRTPPYENLKIDKDVKVFIELYRPSDNRTSEPFEFTYLAEKIYKYGKKRRANSSLSSLTSSSGGSMKSLSELPVIVANHTSLNESNENQENVPMTYHSPSQPNTYDVNVVPPQSYSAGDLLGDALHQALGSPQVVAPMLPNINVSNVAPSNLPLNFVQQPPELQISSEDFERLLRANPNFSGEDRQRLMFDTDWTEYIKAFSLETGSMDLVADSGRRPTAPVQPSSSKGFQFPRMLGGYTPPTPKCNESKATYAADDGQEVKQIVKELVDIMRSKTGYKKLDVRNKLERLFEIRLSNGDTFLHLTLRKNQASMNYIIKMISAMKMCHLLNDQNKLLQTVLHLAVANDMPEQVEFLIANGCDPSIADHEGNTAVHYAVILNACLEPLLKSIKTNKIACNLNVRNHDLNTPLHLTTLYSSVSGTKLLLANGADYKAKDSQNRTVLHLAAYDGRVEILRILMEYVESCDIDIVDGRGNTALQIVCGRESTDGSVEMVQLLLQKNADPKKHGSDGKISAWKLAKDKPEIKQVMAEHMKMFEDVKSDEEFESADESIKESLPELSLYIAEVSELLDVSGALFSLAALFKLDAPLSGDDDISPTTRLLTRIQKLKRHLSSESLAKILENLGEMEAAQIIRKRITNK